MTLNLSKEAREQLSHIAKEQNKSSEDVAKEAVLEYLQEYLQDMQDYKNALNARNNRNKNECVKSSELFKQMGI
ncbi:hypothetical protein DCO58_05980 [Helicobacter saguini]|uniref:CopG family transcriptional regulator n=1 Tax=Helicobacter saguini TaxID=1548018 RepID=A0A347VTG3_9HELI|nr:hypothetical protein [Helicobacter saguini]MWV62110.1 hypothetical protein [Helicobacter saguini]MWV67218.1 hypothetical protein [Helicobacter saguini]MWV69570.1 hypothetical protein [Helicobacter saguini]MWV70879.1 hypothetical protein [Helicobacter saguini]TLD94289.1 hypothetical protein LS64_006100 [Helicobacter saguini]